MVSDGNKDFFISYNKADRGWADWIAWQLQTAEYSVVLQAWDFRPSGNFLLQMDEAIKNTKRTILLLSPDYLDPKAIYSRIEWAASLKKDPDGAKGVLLPIRVRACEPTGLLASITYIDFVGRDIAEARSALLAGVDPSRDLPSGDPPYPGNASSTQPSVPTFPGSWPLIWNVPNRRNLFFTGREQLLQTVHEQLCGTNAAALTQILAIHGLGGIGKTQTAIEYYYRYRHEYQSVFWVRAAAVDMLCSDYVSIAELVNLEVKDNQDQIHILHTVKRWLSRQRNWLLILDNADDLKIIHDYLPEENNNNGHILLTTRDPAVQGIVPGIAVEEMDIQEGINLLLHRARGLMLRELMPEKNVSPEEQDAATRIVTTLGGIPLAIDQAAAYIQQTECGFSRYLERYQKRHADLLKWKQEVPSDYPGTVATTWGLAIEQVELRNPAAAELLRLCAFLDPDAIPEDLLQKGASELGSVLQPLVEDDLLFDAAIRILRSFSLIRRLVDRNCLAIHQLVQVVIKDRLDIPIQQQWAEQIVRAVNAAFPNVVAVKTWEQCQLYLPQVFACVDHLKQYDIQSEAAASLLYRAGQYLTERGRYSEAEPLCLLSLAISEKVAGRDHPLTGTYLNSLANLYQNQGRYKEAEPLYQRALEISENAPVRDNLSIATRLNNLANLYRVQKRYEEAEPLCKRALALCETEGTEHPSMATSLNNLANLYQDQGRYEEAEPLYRRALTTSEEKQGKDHPSIGTILNNLANLYNAQGRYKEAEPLYKRALAISEKAQGKEHPSTGTYLKNLALLYQVQGRYEEAELLYKRALAISEIEGTEHPSIVIRLNNLANLYRVQGRYEEAEPLYKRVLMISEKTMRPDHPGIATILENYADLLEKMQRPEEAAQLQARAQTIRAKQQP